MLDSTFLPAVHQPQVLDPQTPLSDLVIYRRVDGRGNPDFLTMIYRGTDLDEQMRQANDPTKDHSEPTFTAQLYFYSSHPILVSARSQAIKDNLIFHSTLERRLAAELGHRPKKFTSVELDFMTKMSKYQAAQRARTKITAKSSATQQASQYRVSKTPAAKHTYPPTLKQPPAVATAGPAPPKRMPYAPDPKAFTPLRPPPPSSMSYTPGPKAFAPLLPPPPSTWPTICVTSPPPQADSPNNVSPPAPNLPKWLQCCPIVLSP